MSSNSFLMKVRSRALYPLAVRHGPPRDTSDRKGFQLVCQAIWSPHGHLDPGPRTFVREPTLGIPSARDLNSQTAPYQHKPEQCGDGKCLKVWRMELSHDVRIRLPCQLTRLLWNHTVSTWRTPHHRITLLFLSTYLCSSNLILSWTWAMMYALAERLAQGGLE